MTNFTRRQFIRDLGIASSSVLLPGVVGCHGGAKASTPRSGGPLYVIIQGPWLFSLEDQLHVITTDFSRLDIPDPMHHDYSYSDPRSGSGGQPPAESTIPPGQTINFLVRISTSSAPDPSVFTHLKTANDGIVYDKKKVHLDRTTIPTSARHLYFPYPDEVLSAARMFGVTFTLNGSVASSRVADWPAALVLKYANWTNATGYNGESIVPGSGPTYRRFAIRRYAPHGQSACTAQHEDATHASVYLSSLMSFLTFSQGASQPVAQLPICPDTPVQIQLGGDSNLMCSDFYLDPGVNGYCTVPPAAVRGGTLVNCAGGGGITNCC